jgi:hypothetical protein
VYNLLIVPFSNFLRMSKERIPEKIVNMMTVRRGTEFKVGTTG